MQNKKHEAVIGCSIRTIQREIKRGSVSLAYTKPDAVLTLWPDLPRERTYRTEYSTDAAQVLYEIGFSGKGPQLKLGKDFAFAAYVEYNIIKKRMSPYAVLALAKLENKPFAGLICMKTLYNYIDSGVFLRLTNADLPEKHKKRKRDYKRVRVAHNNRNGRSIEERDTSVESREDFGHWEMDTVVGKGRAALLVLTERKTLLQIIRKMPS
ncbi:MAG: IS30 family transposase, partial [Clostridiaceae bacterium]|nr:IS30 family transposase [Clostridiaceae bacterium]